ncbi:MAG: hypothetical protein F6K16_28840 [Symploca sp. SIO2B6]|nr:hypothetical protein [Symploca sp. SIO2B6]
MSGIVGIYNLDSCPVERKNLGRMVDILAHRGPDGVDVWCQGSIGLGHRLLWTTPESLLEKLPWRLLVVYAVLIRLLLLSVVVWILLLSVVWRVIF